jgi:Amt family ammonium transporter
MTRAFLRLAPATAIAAFLASPAFAQDAKIEGADTAWMIGATGLVLMMTIPGLALFYAGMVRKKNALATMAQSLAATFLVSILWAVVGYSLAFTGDGAAIGTLDRIFLKGMGMDDISPLAKTIPESLFMIYQMTFAIITVALVAGSVADRLRFSAFLLFCVFWLLLVYVPIAHWVWGGGFLGTAGVIDFAGGTVVHLNAGVAGLAAAYVLGARRGYGSGKSGAVRSHSGGDRHRSPVGRLVRIQRRLGIGRKLARRDGDRVHASRRERRRIHLDGARMVDARQTVCARNDLRRGRRTWDDHTCVRICFADAGTPDRNHRRRDLLLGLHLAEAQARL